MSLHILFVPFPSPGHLLPLLHTINGIVSDDHNNVQATIATIAANKILIENSSIIDNDSNKKIVNFLILPSSPTVPESTTSLPTPELTPDFLAFLDSLQHPLETLLKDQNLSIDCIVSDALLPWTTDLANKLRIPRIIFGSSGSYPSFLLGILGRLRPQDKVVGNDQLFLVPGLPHPVQKTRSRLPKDLLSDDDDDNYRYWREFGAKINNAIPGSFGILVNSFYEMEAEYADALRCALAKKMWNVGPVSLLCNEIQKPKKHDCLEWLDKNRPGSVLYVCFGSLGQFTPAQFREMAVGLETCGFPFIWVLRAGVDESEWMPEGFEARVHGRGLVLKGWVPQTTILGHHAVGGFVTHCGWNSTVEGVVAGVPMITWPLFVDQFFDERLIVDVLKIGIAVGSEVSSFCKEERTLVSGERLREAVRELMGGGEAADERRRRAKSLSVMARNAVKEGGSSYNDMVDMIRELWNSKMERANSGGDKAVKEMNCTVSL